MNLDPRWAIVTTPTGNRFFGKIVSRREVVGNDGVFLSMDPAYAYAMRADKDGLTRSVNPIDALLDSRSLETFVLTIVYLDDTGPKGDVARMLSLVEHSTKVIEVQNRGLNLKKEAEDQSKSAS